MIEWKFIFGNCKIDSTTKLLFLRNVKMNIALYKLMLSIYLIIVLLFLNHPYQGCIGIAIHMRNVYTAIKAEGEIHSSPQPTWKKKESEMDSTTNQMMHKIKTRLSLF